MRRMDHVAQTIARCRLAADILPIDFTPEALARLLDLRRSDAKVLSGNSSSRGSTARFAGCTLDTAHRLLHTPAGTTLHVPGTEFALLMSFLAHPSRGLTPPRPGPQHPSTHSTL